MASNHSLAEVALPVGIYKTFTYIIPPELSPGATVGTRVIIPFGKKYLTGLIVGLPQSTDIPSLKPIKDILDLAPLVSTELLELCHWISTYYIAPLGDVVKAAIPHALTSGKRVVRLAAPEAKVREALGKIMSNSSHRRKILETLLASDTLSTKELQNRTGTRHIHSVLHELEHAGLVSVEELMPKEKHKPRTQQVILLNTYDQPAAQYFLQTLSRRKKNIRRLLETVQLLVTEKREVVPASEIVKRASVSSVILKEIVRSGIVAAGRQEMPISHDEETEAQTLTIALNADQRNVLERVNSSIDAGTHRTILLHGVTGSGKTQVYIEAIRHCLAVNKTAIVLVPEIALTPQIVRRFRSHFTDHVAVVHSHMSAGERSDIWRRTRRGEFTVIIGPRSAVFAPLARIGLIVVDEEHEASYKQFDASPRYHARDVAVVRGHSCGAVVMLGSATPSMESYFNACNAKYDLLEMPRRIDGIPMPSIAIVDMTKERMIAYAAMKDALPPEQRQKLKEFRQPLFSSLLRKKINERLERREGIILLQNRRGFAPFVECMECGYVESCSRCHVSLTYHLARKHLRCHYCGTVATPNDRCPQCNGTSLQLLGTGTQKVETELATLFPSAKVLRMDLDTTTRRGSHHRMLKQFANREVDILLGTQMVAKGLDFPHVTLVGVISADTQMLLPDFRASERTFQLLTQVAGRAGRSTLRGEVIIQTHRAEHYTLQHVASHDYAGYYENEIVSRKELRYPPFSRIVLIETRGPKEDAVRKHSERFASALRLSNGVVETLGPSPAVIGKINNQYRWHFVLKGAKENDPSGGRMREAVRRASLAADGKDARALKQIIDVDPVGLL